MNAPKITTYAVKARYPDNKLYTQSMADDVKLVAQQVYNSVETDLKSRGLL